MRLAWYWPIYGQDDEVAFTYSRSRGHRHLLETLGEFQGTVLSDGHSAYRRYAEGVPGFGLIRGVSLSKRRIPRARRGGRGARAHRGALSR